MSESPTLGEQRVRATFNPSENETVANLKKKTAALIDNCQNLVPEGAEISGEQRRLIALAQTAFEEACMWAVKAATYSEPGKSEPAEEESAEEEEAA